MYIEKQNFQTGRIRWFKSLCWLFVAVQAVLIFALESAFVELPLRIWQLVVLMLVACCILWVLSQMGFRLHINKIGINLRFWQYPIQNHSIQWSEIKRLRLLSPDELPEDAYWGIPNRDATHIYLLTDRHYKVLSIELLRGTQFFVSTSKPNELLDFLQNSLWCM
ncbi:MAG: hypothetical protein JNL70_02020 [Saprospiraceae bacterium]|nr:hypothetical protein [Saprospiraceae bacterium]